MKKFLVILAVAVSSIVNAQIDPVILKNEKIAVNNVISIFNTLQNSYFDDIREQHIYKHLATLNYLSIPNDLNSILVHQYELNSIESITSYGSKNLFYDKQMLKVLQNSKIFDVHVDTTTLSSGPNPRSNGYAFTIDLSYQQDNGELKTLSLLFNLESSKIVIITTFNWLYEN
jgi:hypothetical protein